MPSPGTKMRRSGKARGGAKVDTSVAVSSTKESVAGCIVWSWKWKQHAFHVCMIAYVVRFDSTWRSSTDLGWQNKNITRPGHEYRKPNSPKEFMDLKTCPQAKKNAGKLLLSANAKKKKRVCCCPSAALSPPLLFVHRPRGWKKWYKTMMIPLWNGLGFFWSFDVRKCESEW